MISRVFSGMFILIAATAGFTQPPLVPSESVQIGTPGASVSGPTLVEDETTVAKTRIAAEAAAMLEQRRYMDLNALAGKLRRDGQTFAQGDWPIAYFYSGVVDLPKGSTKVDWETHLAALRDWFENDPDSISARVAYARALIDYAWEARGSGWAKDVTDEGWRLFGERIVEARRILIAAEDLGRICPVYYSTRLRLGLVDGRPRADYEELFRECLAAFPNYTTFYLVKAHYLLPRWHGEDGEWEAFAAQSADQIGGQAGDMLYAQIVWAMHDARLFGNIFKETKVEWSRTQSGFEGLCTRYPQSVSALSEYCYLAGQSPQGGRGLTRTLFPRLGNRVDLSVWRTKERWTQDRAWAFSSN